MHPEPAQPPSAFFLVGPTGIGKTSIAQHIAESGGYDILSADSMLVYRGMDIGTAKPTPEQRARVRYWGLDRVDPDQSFSVGAWHDHARRAIAETHRANRPLIVVGGTGLYIKSLTHGLDALPPADLDIRRQAERLYEECGIEGLRKELRGRAPERYERLKDKDNPRRLIRALELAGQEPSVPGAWTRRPEGTIIGLEMDRETLYSRIKQRVKHMFEHGLLNEIQALHDTHASLSETAREAIGYEEGMQVLAGRMTRDEAIERTATRTRRLAKRQMTWFRHQVPVEWIDVSSRPATPEVAQQVKEMWHRHGPTTLAH